tara:strand:- start:7544 stop:8842 length:1299 start_codon:yes stop_codon:yes gene_type:complete
MQKSKKRSVFLFGAGSAISWGGPPTSELTKLICKSGIKNKEGEYITKVIFDWLVKYSGLDEWDVNFETIINAIEDIAEYWFNSSNGLINGLAFPLKDVNRDVWEEILNFKVTYKGDRQFSMEIPNADVVLEQDLKFISKDKYPTPESKFFEALLQCLFTEIQARISDYSYVTVSHVKTLENENNMEINDLALKFFANKSERSILRLYNLNYDRVFQYLFYKAGLSADQGFNDEEIFPRSIVHFNPLRIFRKMEENCIYHLHGSAFWEVVPVDSNGLDYYKFVHSPYPTLQVNEAFARFEMEKGKPLLIGNIITGYRKSQRTSLSPFRQMFSAFDQDCHKGEELIVIGYSFSDQHINDIINKAREVNQSQKLVIIDPKIDIDKFLFNHASKWKWLDQIPERKPIGEKIISIPFFNLTFYQMTFREFLEEQVIT